MRLTSVWVVAHVITLDVYGLLVQGVELRVLLCGYNQFTGKAPQTWQVGVPLGALPLAEGAAFFRSTCPLYRFKDP